MCSHCTSPAEDVPQEESALWTRAPEAVLYVGDPRAGEGRQLLILLSVVSYCSLHVTACCAGFRMQQRAGRTWLLTPSVDAHVTMCAWGCAYQKETRLRFDSMKPRAVQRLFGRCRCVPRRRAKPLLPLCSFTQCPHSHLTGLQSRGQKGFATQGAAEYPLGLCQRIAEALLD